MAFFSNVDSKGGVTFSPEVAAELKAERAIDRAEFDIAVPRLSFDEALVKAKQEFKAKKLHLRGWQSHPSAPSFFYRSAADGGFEYKPEATLAASWPNVDLCESPIEVQFYEAFIGSPLFGYSMRLQHEVVCVDRYRLDFAFLSSTRQICIEVDGHDFHERTKEQAQRDKQRDRRLIYAGWRTLRFTGSEIFQNAATCAQEAAAYLGTIS